MFIVFMVLRRGPAMAFVAEVSGFGWQGFADRVPN
jgi:hypothetical protein